MATTASPQNKLYIGNVNYDTKKEDIEELLNGYDIESITIPTRKRRGGVATGKGFLFVDFKPESNVNLDEVIEKFTNIDFKGRQIYLRHPQQRPERDEKESSEEKETSEESKEENTKPKKAKKSRKPKAKKTPDSAATESTEATSVTTESKTTAKKAKKTSKKPKAEKVPLEEGVKSNDSLYIKNIPRDAKTSELREFLQSKDESAKWVNLPLLRLPPPVVKKLEESGESTERKNKGFGFVRFQIKEGETIDDKVAKFNGSEFKGNTLEVTAVVETRVKAAKKQDNEEEEQEEPEQEQEEEQEEQAEKTEA